MNKDLEFIDINLDDKTSSKSSRFGTHKNTGTHFSDDSHDNIEKEYTDETDKSDADITNLPPSSDNPGKRKSHMIIGNRLAYINSEPRRGDIVVFYYPDDESQKFIKRIIGLPGETIYIADGIVYIDGQPLDESAYLTVETYGVSGPFTIPENCYFMMGDNRNSSNDSRFWTNHFVSRDKIIAKALFCYYPSIHLIK